MVENAMSNDLKMLTTLHAKGIMPTFSGGQLDHLKKGSAYVYTQDADENVVITPPDANEACVQPFSRGSHKPALFCL
jgi:hypothetical protein